jgi:hypothetical protein
MNAYDSGPDANFLNHFKALPNYVMQNSFIISTGLLSDCHQSFLKKANDPERFSK